jgi:hypothetical protein
MVRITLHPWAKVKKTVGQKGLKKVGSRKSEVRRRKKGNGSKKKILPVRKKSFDTSRTIYMVLNVFPDFFRLRSSDCS